MNDLSKSPTGDGTAPRAPSTSNPLLDFTDELPRLDAITADHVEPAIVALVERTLAGLERVETRATPTWSNTIEALDHLVEPLNIAWGVVKHLMGVKNGPALRGAHDAVQPAVVQAYMRIAQSEPIYRSLKGLRDGDAWGSLDDAQRRIVTAAIRDAELSGIGLDGDARARFEAIELELADLSTKFGNHVLDATKAFSLVLTEPADVGGLPPTLLAATSQGSDGKGPWKITLDAPVFVPFLEHSRRRDLRETLYRANVTRASSMHDAATAHDAAKAAAGDNLPVIGRILELRQEKATLLGYRSYAEVSLASKMAPGLDAVDKLLAELRAAALPRAKRELAELTDYARAKSASNAKHDGLAQSHEGASAGHPTKQASGGSAPLDLALWDIPFWAERMREERYAYTDEELRPYFALPRVLDGLFATVERLFDVKIRAANGEAPVWHPDVSFFRVADASGADVAAFYLDPYSRPETKQGGAWMNDALTRKRRDDGSSRLPLAYLVCNMTPPSGGRPALMTFREVETLFHELGHGLQHMLTTVDYPAAAGINNVEWDAVELPSQFMENWCYTSDTIGALAKHYETGEPLPRELFDKIVAARRYRAASMTLRQVYLATLDLALHRRPVTTREVLEVQRHVASENTVVAPLPEDRFLCAFTHIFGGGYAAGYYSYKWAEVLSADAFGAFLEAGLGDRNAMRRTGLKFRDTVLALGGSRHPMQVFEAFRGRPPSTRPLLEQSGLVDTSAHG